MREYRKTEKHKAWRKKHYEEVSSPAAKRRLANKKEE
jgi:hypothetical protein